MITKLTFMKQFSLLIIVIIVCTCGVNAQVNNNNDTIEPKTTFNINISGKNYVVSEGEVLNLDTTISKPSIFVKLSDNKKFDDSSLSFEYPKSLVFEYASSAGLKNWTFTGSNIVIMLFAFDVNVPLSMMTDEMKDRFGKENCSIVDFQKELGSKKMKGKRLNVTLVGSHLVYDMYELNLPGNTTWYIAFQNSINDDGSSTEEFKRVFNVVNSTIKFR